MARSSIMGADAPPTRAPGHGTDLLGPSDSSDSGSDMAGIEDNFDADEPTDVATGEDRERPLTSGDAIGRADSDAAGTGERASAAGDAGRREAADIAPDRIIDLAGNGDVPDEDALDDLPLEAAADDDEDADEDEDGEADIDQRPDPRT